MILRRIKMTGFKKFSDDEFEFGPAINVFLGPNEAGKSTIQQAILTALYGVRDKLAGLLPNRDAARSWNASSRCSLELEYEVGGTEYLLDRDVSSGKVTLSSRKPGKTDWRMISEDRKDVARRIAAQTGIKSAYVFNRTISVSQADVAGMDDLKRIGDNIEEVFTGESRVGPDKAIQFIDRHYRKALRKQGNENPGRIDRLEAGLPDLIERLSQARDEERERLALAARLDALDNEIPVKDEEHRRLQNLKDKARQRNELEEKLHRARDDFRGIDRRIEQIRKAQAELAKLDEERKDIGPIGDMDPEQLLTRQRELETRQWRAKNGAEHLTKELDAEQARLDRALEVRKELLEVEEKIKGFGTLSRENLEEVEERAGSIADRIREAAGELRRGETRLNDMAAHIETLNGIVRRHGSVDDPDDALARWHELLQGRNEARGRLESADKEHFDHSGRKPRQCSRWKIEMAVGAGIALIGIVLRTTVMAGSLVAVGIAGFGVVAMMYALGDYIVGRMKLREWRKVHARLSNSVSDARDAFREAEQAVKAFADDLGEAEDVVEGQLMEHRDAQRESTRLAEEDAAFRRNRGDIEARHKQAQADSREFAEGLGARDIEHLRESCRELRGLTNDQHGMLRNIMGIFGAPATRDAIGLIDEAYGKINKLSDEQKEMLAEVGRIEAQSNELLERTNCVDQGDLTRQAEALRELTVKHGEARTRLETMLGKKTLTELSEHREECKTLLAELSGRLDEHFAGFEPTIEQAEQWQIDYQNLTEELEALRAERNQVDGRLKALLDRPGPSPAELAGEREFVEQEISRGDATAQAARLAMNVLREVKESHHAEYLPLVEESTSKHFSKMTNSRYPAVKLAETWPSIFVADGERDDISPDDLSRGTADQLYFSLRLAVGEALSRNTVLPLVLDDPFANFDPGRIAEGMGILGALARDGRQIIFFTHDPRQAEHEDAWREQGLRVDHFDLSIDA